MKIWSPGVAVRARERRGVEVWISGAREGTVRARERRGVEVWRSGARGARCEPGEVETR